MNARIQTLLPALGAAIHGGLFHGVLLVDGQLWGEVTAPKAEGEISGLAWHPKYKDVPGAASTFDGLANTIAMAAAGSPLAKAVRELRIGGFDDWYLPARGGQLLQWDLKPLLPEAETFEDAWYWSSTQYSRLSAFGQYFGNGSSDYSGKDWEGGRARAVRRCSLESLIA